LRQHAFLQGGEHGRIDGRRQVAQGNAKGVVIVGGVAPGAGALPPKAMGVAWRGSSWFSALETGAQRLPRAFCLSVKFSGRLSRHQRLFLSTGS
jgi:hypothetical protein